MANRYALNTMCIHNSVSGFEETIQQGAMRDSTSQQFTQTGAAAWSSTILVAGTQIDPKLAAYLVAYPNT